VSDNPQWQSPSGGFTPSAPPAAASGFPPPPPPPGGWTPPPKPGLIPLRPLDLGTILGASFRVLRRNPRPTFGAALLIQGIVYLVGFGVVGLVTFLALSRVNFSSDTDLSAITAGNVGVIGLSLLVPILLTIGASALLQGIIVVEVSRAALGEKQSFRQLWGRVRGRFGALIGWTALIILAVTITLAIVAGLVFLFVATLGVAGIVIGVIIGILGGLALFVGWFWISTKLSLVPSVLVLERLTIRAAVARSWSLTRGYFWRTLGIQLLVAVILSIASQIVSAPLSFIGPLIIQLTDPNGQGGVTTVLIAGGIALLSLIVSVVIGAITTVVQSATTALIYLDLRMRKEGLDLELARFVESRQAGAADLADPYLPRVS
jgi:hypothetical protein